MDVPSVDYRELNVCLFLLILQIAITAIMNISH